MSPPMWRSRSITMTSWWAGDAACQVPLHPVTQHQRVPSSSPENDAGHLCWDASCPVRGSGGCCQNLSSFLILKLNFKIKIFMTSFLVIFFWKSIKSSAGWAGPTNPRNVLQSTPQGPVWGGPRECAEVLWMTTCPGVPWRTTWSSTSASMGRLVHCIVYISASL